MSILCTRPTVLWFWFLYTSTFWHRPFHCSTKANLWHARSIFRGQTLQWTCLYCIIFCIFQFHLGWKPQFLAKFQKLHIAFRTQHRTSYQRRDLPLCKSFLSLSGHMRKCKCSLHLKLFAQMAWSPETILLDENQARTHGRNCRHAVFGRAKRILEFGAVSFDFRPCHWLRIIIGESSLLIYRISHLACLLIEHCRMLSVAWPYRRLSCSLSDE